MLFWGAVSDARMAEIQIVGRLARRSSRGVRAYVDVIPSYKRHVTVTFHMGR